MTTNNNIFREKLTVAEVSALLRKSPKTLKNWRSKGRGPEYDTSGQDVLYYKDDVINYYNTTYRHVTTSNNHSISGNITLPQRRQPKRQG